MKRVVSIILSISLLASCLVFMPTITASAESVTLSDIGGDTLEVTDATSFRYGVPKLNGSNTKLTKDTNIRQPLSNIAEGWDGTYIISSVDGTLTGPAAGKAQESLTMQWINRSFVLNNNTIMFYVELPDYEKANANWALSLSSFIINQGGTNFWVNRGEAINYSYISPGYDRWQFASTVTTDGTVATLADLPSGFKGFVRIDISSAKFYDSKIDLSKYYMLIEMGFGFNAVGGDCGDLRFGGVFYYPDDDKNNATLMTSRGKYSYELGGNSDAVLVTAHASKWNVTLYDSADSSNSYVKSEAYSASCPGGSNGIIIDSTTGEAITSPHYYQKMWPNIKMQPGVDTFMIYVELPTYTADTPALYLAMPGITQNGAWPTYVDPANSEYSYLSLNDTEWKKGMVGASGALSELGSGFKGYIKFDLKKFAFYHDTNSGGRKAVDFSKNYNVEAIQLRFNHVGGENGKLVIGSLYSVLKDSESTKITGVSTSTATAELLTIGSVKSMRSTSVTLTSDTYNAITKDATVSQISSDKAGNFDGAYVVSSKDGALTGPVASKGNDAFKMQYINIDLTPNNSSMMFYVEAPDYDKANADWGLKISSLAINQGGTSFNANLTKRAKYSYLSATGTEWVEGTVRAEGDANSVLANLPSGFKGYLCFDFNDFTYNANGSKKFNPSADFQISSLGIGYNAVGGDCGNLVFGGVLYFPTKNGNLTTDLKLENRYYKLTKNPDAIITTVAGPRHNVTITNTTNGEAASEATYFSADCVGRVADKSVILGSKTDAVVTDLHMYSKLYDLPALTPGVDTFMTYIEMPTYSETDAALRISQPSFIQNGKETYVSWANGKYSYMSIFDGEWKTATFGSDGELSEIGSGFKGYVKFDLKTFGGYDSFITKIDTNATYNLNNVRFRYKYVGGDNGNLIIGAFYGLVEDSDSSNITIVDKRKVDSKRFMCGDLTADGKINSSDIAIARKALLGVDVIPEDTAVRSDANDDGVQIDIRDLVRMKKISVGTAAPLAWKDKNAPSEPSISKWLESGQIPYYTEGTVTETVAGGGTKVMTAVGTTAETYKNYLKALEFAGFKLYTSNTIENNLFATYTNENLTVNAYYIDSNKTVRVVWEPLSTLPGLKSENVYDTTTKVDTVLTAIDLAQAPIVEGMSFIIKLEDNSFIVFDGGYADGYNGESKKLYNQLVAQTPAGQKPVIAAWIFSHAHSDHVGNFSEFSLNYHDDVIIEKFFFNFPSDEEIKTQSPGILGTHIKEYGVFKTVMAEYYADVPVVKVHTGNKFYIRNAEFEVLQTFEDFMPDKLASHNFNTTSTIYRMYVGGQSFMLLGDATPTSETLMLEQFGSYLKSDVLQLAHHGIDGLLEAYQTYDPTYCLWPAAKQFYKQYNNSAANHWLLYESENVKEVLVTGYGTYSVKLPINLTGTYVAHPYTDSHKNPAFFE